MNFSINLELKHIRKQGHYRESLLPIDDLKGTILSPYGNKTADKVLLVFYFYALINILEQLAYLLLTPGKVTLVEGNHISGIEDLLDVEYLDRILFTHYFCQLTVQQLVRTAGIYSSLLCQRIHP